MGFWELFGKNKKEKSTGEGASHNEIHAKLRKLLPTADNEKLLESACIAGLMARVAWCDLNIHARELDNMKQSLAQWTDFSRQDIEAVATIAVENIQELAGQENHKYTEALETMGSAKRYGLLKALFSLAASDGLVAEKESQEIRLISKGLLLETKHFISARATVLDHLAGLKKESKG